MWWKNNVYIPFIATSAVVFSIGRFTPRWLTPFNRAWMRLGDLLHRIASPVILGLLYFGLITPFGLVMRLKGHDPMKRGFDPNAKSYWIPRTPPGPAPDSLPRQF